MLFAIALLPLLTIASPAISRRQDVKVVQLKLKSVEQCRTYGKVTVEDLSGGGSYDQSTGRYRSPSVDMPALVLEYCSEDTQWKLPSNGPGRIELTSNGRTDLQGVNIDAGAADSEGITIEPIQSYGPDYPGQNWTISTEGRIFVVSDKEPKYCLSWVKAPKNPKFHMQTAICNETPVEQEVDLRQIWEVSDVA